MTTRVWLVRHGETAVGDGLSAVGQKQVQRVAEHLAAEPLAAIYSSPLRRAVESARIIAARHSCSYIEDADLREISFGDCEGLTCEEIAVQYPQIYRQWMEAPAQVRFPNGESLAEMRPRVLQAFEAIRKDREGQTIALVTHAGVIRILIAWILQVPDDHLFRLAQDYAAMNLVIWVDGVPILQRMNFRESS